MENHQNSRSKPAAYSSVSRSIKILSEIEKIWILYDLDDNGTLEYGEIMMYLKEMSPNLDLSDE